MTISAVILNLSSKLKSNLFYEYLRQVLESVILWDRPKGISLTTV